MESPGVKDVYDYMLAYDIDEMFRLYKMWRDTQRHLVFNRIQEYRAEHPIDEMRGMCFVSSYEYEFAVLYFLVNDIPLVTTDVETIWVAGEDAIAFSLKFTGKIGFKFF